MGLWSGFSSSISSDSEQKIALTKRLREQENEIRSNTKINNDLKQVKENLNKTRLSNSPFGKGLNSFRTSKQQVGKQVGLAVGTGMNQQVNFSVEQEALRQMFGGGEKIWGVNNQPVKINNDLNPSRLNPNNETAGMFGFGSNGERSGLF